MLLNYSICNFLDYFSRMFIDASSKYLDYFFVLFDISFRDSTSGVIILKNTKFVLIEQKIKKFDLLSTRDPYSILQSAVIRWYYLSNIYTSSCFSSVFQVVVGGNEIRFRRFYLPRMSTGSWKSHYLWVYARERVVRVLVIWPDYLPFEWSRVILKWFRFNFQHSTRRGRPDIR